MTLAAQSCIPCTKESVALDAVKVANYLQKVPGWSLKADGKAIEREWKFKNFREALAFVNKVGEIAEAAKHHPDISFGWGYAKLVLQTHSIGGLFDNDFIVAAKISTIEIQ